MILMLQSRSYYTNLIHAIKRFRKMQSTPKDYFLVHYNTPYGLRYVTQRLQLLHPRLLFFS